MECCRLMELANPLTVLEMAMLGIIFSGKHFKLQLIYFKFYFVFRAEAVSTIFLQKARDARRVYASVVHIKTNEDGYKSEDVTSSDGKIQNQLMREVYMECGVDPKDVSYVEAHGIGAAIDDAQEVNAIADLFCNGRTEPLFIGSVKSNMGHAESASGMCAIAKAIIAMESGSIPANLHFKNPNPEIPALVDGRVKVCSCYYQDSHF